MASIVWLSKAQLWRLMSKRVIASQGISLWLDVCIVVMWLHLMFHSNANSKEKRNYWHDKIWNESKEICDRKPLNAEHPAWAHCFHPTCCVGSSVTTLLSLKELYGLNGWPWACGVNEQQPHTTDFTNFHHTLNYNCQPRLWWGRGGVSGRINTYVWSITGAVWQLTAYLPDVAESMRVDEKPGGNERTWSFKSHSVPSLFASGQKGSKSYLFTIFPGNHP